MEEKFQEYHYVKEVRNEGGEKSMISMLIKGQHVSGEEMSVK